LRERIQIRHDTVTKQIDGIRRTKNTVAVHIAAKETHVTAKIAIAVRFAVIFVRELCRVIGFIRFENKSNWVQIRPSFSPLWLCQIVALAHEHLAKIVRHGAI
jgi:hypothetical protein